MARRSIDRRFTGKFEEHSDWTDHNLNGVHLVNSPIAELLMLEECLAPSTYDKSKYQEKGRSPRQGLSKCSLLASQKKL